LSSVFIDIYEIYFAPCDVDTIDYSQFYMQVPIRTLLSRIKTLYVFDEYSLVERSQVEWFQHDPKEIHECRIIKGSNFFRADTIWLNCSQDQWQERASRYWNGEMTDDPFPEVLVHGALYFPNWLGFAT